MSRTAWPLLLAIAAGLLYVCCPQDRLFNDGPLLIGFIESSPAPYYNVAYVPLGWVLYHGLEPVLHWSPLAALEALSGVAGALSLFLTARLLEGRGQVGWVPRWSMLLLAVSPGMLFFATLAEVHALQMLGVVLGMLLALSARGAAAPRASWIALMACALPPIFHLTGVVLAPCLIALAWGREPGRGVSWRGLPRLVALVVLAGGLFFCAAWAVARVLDPMRSLANPVEMLWMFAGDLCSRLVRRGPFTFGEVWRYLLSEFWRPAGLLLVLAIAALPLWRSARDLVWPLLLALAPYLILVPQGGVRQFGGYYMSLLPLLALWLGAVAVDLPRPQRGWQLTLAALALLGAQGWLGIRNRAENAERLEARAFADRIAQAIPEPAFLYTDELARVLAVAKPAPQLETMDVVGVLDMNPARVWPGTIQVLLGTGSARLEAGVSVYIDAELVREPARCEQAATFAAAIRASGVGLVPVPADDPIAYRVVVR